MSAKQINAFEINELCRYFHDAEVKLPGTLAAKEEKDFFTISKICQNLQL